MKLLPQIHWICLIVHIAVTFYLPFKWNVLKPEIQINNLFFSIFFFFEQIYAILSIEKHSSAITTKLMQ